MITSCAVGIRGCSRIVDPTNFQRVVDETPDKTRGMLRDYFETGALEDPRTAGVEDAAGKLGVEDYSDGSLRVTLAGPKNPLLALVVRFAPKTDGDGTRVEVTSDATGLARSLRGVDAPDLHRQIRDEVQSALGRIDRHRTMETGFLLSRLIARARDD
jgi:hypothetical protein